MRIKGAALVIVMTCMGTALAMAISGQDDASGVVGAVIKNHPAIMQAGVGQNEQSQSDMRFDLSAIKRTVPDKIRNSSMFQSKSWYTQPLPAKSLPQVSAPPQQLPPPPPSAPQLPFTFIGRMIDGDDVTLYLTNNNQQYAAKLGDVLDGAYRVDKITDKSAVLTYIPMNIQQELVFNSTAIGISALSASASVTTMQSSAQSRQQSVDPR